MAHNFAGLCLRIQFGCRSSFLTYSLLSAKEHLEKGIFSRWATIPVVEAPMTAAVIFFSLNSTFVAWKYLTKGGGLMLGVVLGT